MISSRTPAPAATPRAPAAPWAAETRRAIRALPETPPARVPGHLAWELRATARDAAPGSWRRALGSLG